MQVQIDLNYEGCNIDPARIEELAVFTMEALELPENAEVSITFVDNEEMTALNKQYRGLEGPTDVLSFECDNLDDGFPSDQDCDTYMLGDVVIAPEVATKQSALYGNTPECETDMLVIHGILHLCGFDHIQDEDAAIMEPKQESLLAEWQRKAGLS